MRDLIRQNRDLHELGEALTRRALSSPCRVRAPFPAGRPCRAVRRTQPAACFVRDARFTGTPAEAYLCARCITGRLDWPALRNQPSVYYRDAEDAPLESWPVLLAAATDLDAIISGIQRTWLDPNRPAKAPLGRALGHLLGNGVRFGMTADILVAGEGVETMLAVKSLLPSLPVIAGLSANHLAALDLPPAPGSEPAPDQIRGPGQALLRLCVARDDDAAGLDAANRLRERNAGLEVRELVPGNHAGRRRGG